MVHFLRNKLYRTTMCKEDKGGLQTATSYTMVSCPECLDLLIAWKEKELGEVKAIRAKTKTTKLKPKKRFQQLEIEDV